VDTSTNDVYYTLPAYSQFTLIKTNSTYTLYTVGNGVTNSIIGDLVWVSGRYVGTNWFYNGNYEILTTFRFILLPFTGMSAGYVSTQSGLFSAGSTWVGGTAPSVDGDTWRISTGHAVTYGRK